MSFFHYPDPDLARLLLRGPETVEPRPERPQGNGASPAVAHASLVATLGLFGVTVSFR